MVYFVGLSRFTLVGFRAFSRSRRDWSLGRDEAIVRVALSVRDWGRTGQDRAGQAGMRALLG